MSSIEVQDKLEDRGSKDDIAVIGMACVFPGAPDVAAYWHNIISKVDCITDAPENWSLEISPDLHSTEKGQIYCKRGGFLLDRECEFNPIKHGIMPTGVEGSEPDQFLAVRVAHEALADAGYLDSPRDKKRTAVILGRGSYVNAGLLNLVQHGWIVDQTLQILKSLHPEYSDQQLQAIKKELVTGLPPLNAETVPGFVPNIAAGRIANRLDLMGPSYTVDAACASSLMAVENGVKRLQHHECDLALVGGIQGGNTALSYRMFCLIDAMSRSCQIRPFDKDADGTILGEGLGMVVLKRRLEAERDGDRIYALIKGVGTSSDGRALGLLAPRREGAELAFSRAYESANLLPKTVGLIEAHGTGTPTGDVTEVEALRQVFGDRDGLLPSCAMGSVKSMIGHPLGAAGIAGLIKAILALYHRVLPPTLNCDEPNPKLELEKTPFYINTETRPWIHGSQETPRRAGVNALGFGGINAHVILEEYTGDNETEAPSYQREWDTEVFILQGDSRHDLIRQGQGLRDYLSRSPDKGLKDLAYTLNCPLGDTPSRLAIVASSLQELEKKLDRALKRLANHECVQIKDRQGIYFFQEPLNRRGKLAFLFPGEGSQYVNMLSDLCIHFPEVRKCFDRMDKIMSGHARGYVPSDFIFPRPAFSKSGHVFAEERLWKMDGAIEAVLTANYAMCNLLSHLEIRPEVILGHSTGEYSAMRISGIFDPFDASDKGQRTIELNRSYEEVAAKDRIPKAVLVSVGDDSERVGALIHQVGADIYIGMDNCPHQTVVVGIEAEIQNFIDELNRQGLIYQVLPFDRPYHTPLFKAYADTLRQFFERWPVARPNIPIYSCTTEGLYPTDPQEIRRLAVEHWIRPVGFRKTIERMYADGVRIFAEVGPKGILTAFVDDILRGKEHLAIPSDLETRSGIGQLNHMVGMMAAHGVSMKLDHLYRRRAPQKVVLYETDDRAGKNKDAGSPMRLCLHLPRLQILHQRLTREESESTAGSGLGKTARVTSALITESPAPSGQRALGRQNLTGAPGGSTASSDYQKIAQPPASSAPESASKSPGVANGRSVHDQPSLVMQEYFQTMDHFLEVQQEVMRSFLSGRLPAGAPSVPPPVLNQQGLPEDIADSGEDLPAPFAAGNDGQSLSPGEIESMLLTLISERTGYPKEMLDFNLDMEADLGIDSIKRIEVLGAFSERAGLKLDGDMAQASRLKTLNQVIEFLRSHLIGTGTPHEDSGQHEGMGGLEDPENVLQSKGDVSSYPMIGEVVTLVSGRELEAIRRISLDKDRYLYDHTIGGRMSTLDDTLLPLPVMPLTLSMEILAEAGALLVPGKVLTGIKNIRASRWISLEKSHVTLRIVARVHPDSPEDVSVQIYNLDEDTPLSKTPVIEGLTLFASAYPEIPQKAAFSLQGERTSSWTPERLYTEGMFHGPFWQGVSSIERWGEDGSVSTLRVLPTNDFFRSEGEAPFLTDPIVLDAAGQIVGFWTMEHLERGFIVFPYRAKALHIYRAKPPVHQMVKCEAKIKLFGTQQISSDIDMTGEDGKLWMRLEGWEDKRFDLPSAVYNFLLSPIKEMASIPWEAPVASFPNSGSLFCHRIDRLFRGDESFWRKVFAYLILNHRERETYGNLGKSEQRKTHWLMGRLVAKDAVRMLLRQCHGIEIGPADVEIIQDKHGRPIPTGLWAEQVENLPCLSLAHTDGMAVAIASGSNGNEHVGIDVEKIRALDNGVERTAFTPQELELLDAFEGSEREQWVIRFWGAKEAMGKALGRGMVTGPRSFAVKELDTQNGIVKLSVRGKLRKEFPDLDKKAVSVKTIIKDEYIVASTVCRWNGYDSSE